MPSVEGKDGFFFRIFADLRMQHPLTDVTADQMSQLAAALKAHGTTMLYVPIPTKSVTLPSFLPEEAALFGFNEDVAVSVYEDQIARLKEKGVLAVDLLQPLRTADGSDPPFFRSDFHWTSRGAETAAQTIGALLKGLPEYAEITPVTFETRPMGAELAVSGMRRTLQAYCVLSLPPVISTAYETVEVASADASLDIFGDSGGGEEGGRATRSRWSARPSRTRRCRTLPASSPNTPACRCRTSPSPAATSSAPSPPTSPRVSSSANRPKFMVWENPIYNNLAQFGTGSLTELIAAARNECQPVATTLVIDKAKGLFEADLSGTTVPPNQVLLADAGDNNSRDVVLSFESRDGRTFTREVHRGDLFSAARDASTSRWSPSTASSSRRSPSSTTASPKRTRRFPSATRKAKESPKCCAQLPNS